MSADAPRTLDIRTLVPGSIEVVGALDFDQRPQGMSPRRLPDWTRAQLPQPMDVMVRMPSGVRLRFATSARRLGLSFHATNLVTPPAARRSIPFSLEIDSELHSTGSDRGNTIVLNPRNPGDFQLQRGEPDTVWFEGLSADWKCCELWLPHNAFIELRSLSIDADAKIRAAESDSRPRWLHYGSSISHCMEADQPGLIWPAVAARAAGCSLQNLGFGGQCHLDQFVARTIRDSGADLISIKTGINVINMDSMRERVFTPAVHGFLDTIRERAAKTPILLISPIFCPSAEHQPGPTLPDESGKFVTFSGNSLLRQGCLTLVRVRELLSRIVAQRRSDGDHQLHYVDGLSLFGAEDARDLPDDLHPNPAGYIRMGERFAPVLKRLLQ
ncbi:MAG: SGNH/GDSL hydrolase family protein [Pseudomonadales bacterium]|nr:lipase [Pseudomonadales bacterium]